MVREAALRVYKRSGKGLRGGTNRRVGASTRASGSECVEVLVMVTGSAMVAGVGAWVCAGVEACVGAGAEA
ncbi:hypothetical protein M8J76_011906 [Diaphorina citri]|nr:hypothetical protein M8J76_011906 [Diaphorina citri]